MKSLFLPIALFFLHAVSALGGVTVVGDLIQSKTIKPGEPIEGIIQLKNSDDKPVEVKIFQLDYLCYASGKTVYCEPGSSLRSNARWFSVSPARITVQPNDTASVLYKGKAPQDASLKGTYWSLIMVEPVAAAVPEVKTEKEKFTMGLQPLIRFGVQIVSEVGNSGTESLKILDKNLVRQDNKRSLQLDVENTGQRLQVPALWLEVYNQEGVSIGKFEGGKSRIYPGCSVRYNVPLTTVPPGKYTALAILDAGSERVTGAQYELQIEK